jgi:hypothetical protein
MVYEKSYGSFEIARLCSNEAGNKLCFIARYENNKLMTEKWKKSLMSEALSWALHAELVREMNSNNECAKFTRIEMEV